jgi:pimeloyl-ACP methyl ester carboxylesterase
MQDFYNYKETHLFYSVSGEGKDLLLMHGFLEDSSMWNALLPSLEKDFKVWRVDFFGHGKSPAHSYNHSMSLFASALLGLLKSHKVTSVLAVGHSMGGYVGLEMLAQQPNLFSSFVLLNSTPAPDSNSRKEDRLRAIEAVQKYPDAFVQMAVTNLFAERMRNTLIQEIKSCIRTAKQCSQQGIIATIHGLKDRQDHTETFRNTTCRKLIITGKEDTLIKHAEIKQIAKTANALLVSLNGGHMTHLEFPEELQQILLYFFK